MKLMKWMTVTALATATVFGSFVESVEARFGRGFSERGGDATGFRSLFTLFEVGRDGQPIEDTIADNNIVFFENLGYFPGAVESYVDYTTVVRPDGTLVGEDGIQLDDLFDLPDGTNLAATQDSISSFISFDNGDQLINAINDKLEEKNFDLSQLVTADIADLKAEKDENNPQQIIYSFINRDTGNVLETFVATTNDSDLTASVNSLSQIIDNFFRTGPFDAPRSEDSGATVSEIEFDEEIPDPQAVPESRGITSLLGLGVLGLGVVLKRKLQ